jgi:hypothetical protein
MWKREICTGKEQSPSIRPTLQGAERGISPGRTPSHQGTRMLVSVEENQLDGIRGLCSVFHHFANIATFKSRRSHTNMLL